MAWLLTELATISSGSPSDNTECTSRLAMTVCRKVVFPVPGGPLTAKIRLPRGWVYMASVSRWETDKGKSLLIWARCRRLV